MGRAIKKLARYCRHVESSFLIIIFFQRQNKTKAPNFIKHETETFLLHRLSKKCLISFYFIILLQVLRNSNTKLLDSQGKDRQVLGFVNQVVGSNDGHIFKLEKRFFDFLILL